ncbi:hypothetical protein [Ilumatobacter coccineus]|uniref:Uncharacterized protein n=1 Tax=Ilumatobacter coccineus (strain NBRC 103263 / KCTC 29153 / YM16-304) TaxID=1313172 RepID=A0A6C7E7A4_ILUCY|nr:hypothetical protein [Ilumatobacter coccineus]BAN01055.1 hypothetical protein YM304_07410 [Ilumatobacter coccineus YM16-304]
MRSDEELRPVMARIRAAVDERTAGVVVSPPPFETILARAQGQPPTPPTAAPLPLPAVASGPGGTAAGTGAGGTGAAGAAVGASTLPAASFVPVPSLGGARVVRNRIDAPAPETSASVPSGTGGRRRGSLAVKLLVPVVAVAAAAVFFLVRGGQEDSTDAQPATDGVRDAVQPDVDTTAEAPDDGDPAEQDDEAEAPDDGGPAEQDDEAGADADRDALGDPGDEPAGDDVVAASDDAANDVQPGVESADDPVVVDAEPAVEPVVEEPSSSEPSAEEPVGEDAPAPTAEEQPAPNTEAALDERLQRRAEMFITSLVDVDAAAYETFFGPQCDREQAGRIVDDFDRYAEMWAGFRPRITSFISGPDSGTTSLVYFIEEAGGDLGASLPWEFIDDEWYPDTCDVNATVFGRGG